MKYHIGLIVVTFNTFKILILNGVCWYVNGLPPEVHFTCEHFSGSFVIALFTF